MTYNLYKPFFFSYRTPHIHCQFLVFLVFCLVSISRGCISAGYTLTIWWNINLWFSVFSLSWAVLRTKTRASCMQVFFHWTISKLTFCWDWFYLPTLALNFLYSLGRPWTLNPSASAWLHSQSQLWPLYNTHQRPSCLLPWPHA